MPVNPGAGCERTQSEADPTTSSAVQPRATSRSLTQLAFGPVSVPREVG